MHYTYEILSLAFMAVICFIHAKEFLNNKKIGKWFHRIWLFIAGAIAFVFVWLSHWDLWLAAALILLHAVGYNQILNWMRHEKMFYINGEEPGNTGAGTDRVLKKLGKLYPIGWAICLIGLILIQIKL